MLKLVLFRAIEFPSSSLPTMLIMSSPRLTLISVKSATRSLHQEINDSSCKAYRRFSIAPFLIPSFEHSIFQQSTQKSRTQKRQFHVQERRQSQGSFPRCTPNAGISSSSSSSSSYNPRNHAFLRNDRNHQQQRRHSSILSSLSDNPAAYKKKIRRGRGPSSGKGKMSGRGQKGTKARGKVRPGFEGGQTPIEIVKGKRGFVNRYVKNKNIVVWTL